MSPTGYTQPVKDGEITTLEEFAWTCARAFGAFMELRDSPSDADLTKHVEVEPRTFYRDALERERERLKELEAMTPEQAEAAAAKAYSEEHERIAKYRTESTETRERYEAMLEKARAWEPPTEEHQGMKKFMIEQLEESIKFDSHDWEYPAKKSGQEWLEEELHRCRCTIARDEEQWV